jgi:Rad52/22 family double-strand break repair protein
MTTQLERLARPVPPKYVSPPATGKFGDYVGHDIITQILLAVCGPFSFRVEQLTYSPDGLLDGCTASLTVLIDDREVTVTEAGECDFPQNKKTQGERLKHAASDALKRCAMRFGLGLHLWSKGDYFLYEQLRSQGFSGSPEEGRTSAAPAAPVLPETSPSPAELGEVSAGGGMSASEYARARARTSALVAERVSVSDALSAKGLRPLRKKAETEVPEHLAAYCAVLDELEAKLAASRAPFEEVS